MPPVEQRPPPPGNPGASLYVRRRHGQRRAGASAATARRAGGGHGASAGSDWRLRAGRRRGPDASRRGRNTGCRDRSGCTRRPGCGTRRTGTDGLEGPTTPPDRAGSAGRSRPSAPHCCGTAFIGTVSGAARSSSFQAREGHRRAHLLRLGSGCTPPSRASRDSFAPRRTHARRDTHHSGDRDDLATAVSLRPARSPCRATGQTHPLSIRCSARHPLSR